MEDPAEEVHVCVLDGLRGVEVVRHEGDATCDFRGEGGGRRDGSREILHDELEIREAVRELDADEAVGASNVDDGAGDSVEGCPVIGIEEVGELVAFAPGEGLHSSSEALGSRWVLAEGREHGLDAEGVVCYGEAGLGGFRSGGVSLEGGDCVY